MDDPASELVLVVEEEERLGRFLDDSVVDVELAGAEDGAKRLRVLDHVLRDESVESIAIAFVVLQF